MVRRMVLWSGLDAWTAEAARVEIGEDGVRATGTQLGDHQVPYRLDYALDATGPGFVTRHLRVAAAGEGWRRSIDLLRGEDGTWQCATEAEGEVALSPPGLGDAAAVLGPETLDCDLGLCPLTNLMPVRRHALATEPGAHDFTMAWVSVPDLAIRADGQRYEHVRSGVVRFSQPSSFTAELQLDDDGLVRFYPGIARRV
jgi:hypothetical protein